MINIKINNRKVKVKVDLKRHESHQLVIAMHQLGVALSKAAFEDAGAMQMVKADCIKVFNMAANGSDVVEIIEALDLEGRLAQL